MSTPRPITQVERLTRIETILEDAFGDHGTVRAMAMDIKAIRGDLDNDVADLAKLKNRGAGILVGVAIACTSIGAALRPSLDSFMGLFR